MAAMSGFASSKEVQKAAAGSDPVQGLAYYMPFYIALLGIVYVAFILLYRAIDNFIGFIYDRNRHSSEGDSSRFFGEYGTALSVFIMSMAVQGILLGLNFYLPAFWRAAKEPAVKALLLSLSCVVLFCSSWFSFVYIVGRVYGNSWDMERQLLVQSAYRRAVYDGSDYTREYQEILNENLRQRIMSLSDRANRLKDQTVDVDTYNWEEERAHYTAEDFSARSPMRTVIDAMEKALGNNASSNIQEQTADILISMREILESEIDSLTAQISYTDEAIKNANQNIWNAQTRVSSAPDGTDLDRLISQADRASAYADHLQADLQEQQEKLNDYREALSQVRLYQASLGHAGGGPGNLVSASLRNIQQELFLDEPDLSRLETLALDVFKQLQTAMNAGADGASSEGGDAPNADSAPGEEGGTSNEEDSTSTEDMSHNETQTTYQQLLFDTDNFIQELRNYRALKSASTQFDAMLEELRTNSATQLSPSSPDETENQGVPDEAESSDVPGEAENQGASGEAESSDVPGETENPNVPDTPDETGEPDPSATPEDGGPPAEEDGEPKTAGSEDAAAPAEWKNTWLARLDNLKSLISGLPAYSGTENRILREYNRAESADTLDEVIRKYIADHNAVQQGLIYLGSPYRGVAVFSLLLAFFLDIAAFVTGLVIDIVEKRREEEDEENPKDSFAESHQQVETDQDSWEPPVGLNRYIYLNGDLHREKGKSCYRGIENGLETWIALDSIENTLEEKSGLYIRRGKALLSVKAQELAFINTEGGPRDGIYFDCILVYDEGLLSIQSGEKTELRNLATVEKDLTVYQLSDDGCEVFPIKYLEKRIWRTAVITLTQRGTGIAAVYLLW